MKICTSCGAEWPDSTNYCPNDGEGLRSAEGDLVGSVLADKYRIVRKLGEGGMGAVYLGEHVKIHRFDAIKVLTKELAHNADAVARFNREAANAARINHPNVCAIYDFGETAEGLIFLAMEYIEGETLASLLKREGCLPPARAAAIIAQAASALQAAHDMGIVHRDLKPDNMMLARARDGSDHVKVVDFGIAKAVGGTEEGQKVTKTGLVIGTPEYMSPEQLSGDVLDGRSDVYSLALVSYRALTGRLPFEADTAQEVLIARLTDEPAPLAEAAPQLASAPRLQSVFDRALQRMPGDRYGTASAFASDLMNATRQLPAAARPASTDAATQLVDTAAGEVLPPTRLSPASTPATPQPVPSTRPSDAVRRPAPARDGGKKPALVVAAVIGAVAVVGGGAAVVLTGGGDAATEPQPAIGSVATADSAAPRAQTGTQGPDVQPITTPATTPERRAVDPPPAGGTETRTGQPTRDPAPTGVRTVDLAALSAELDGMIERLDNESTRAEAMNRLERVYSDTSIPDSLRASAASMLAFGHQSQGDLNAACDWVRRAAQRAPSNPQYARMLEQLRCAA